MGDSGFDAPPRRVDGPRSGVKWLPEVSAVLRRINPHPVCCNSLARARHLQKCHTVQCPPSWGGVVAPWGGGRLLVRVVGIDAGGFRPREGRVRGPRRGRPPPHDGGDDGAVGHAGRQRHPQDTRPAPRGPPGLVWALVPVIRRNNSHLITPQGPNCAQDRISTPPGIPRNYGPQTRL